MTRPRASSRRAAIAVMAASAAAPITLVVIRIAPRAVDPPGIGKDGPCPNHTVMAVCSDLCPSRLDTARSMRTAAGITGWRFDRRAAPVSSCRSAAVAADVAADRIVDGRASPAVARASGPAALSIAGALETIAHRITGCRANHRYECGFACAASNRPARRVVAAPPAGASNRPARRLVAGPTCRCEYPSPCGSECRPILGREYRARIVAAC
jgi:hypothetical protein